MQTGRLRIWLGVTVLATMLLTACTGVTAGDSKAISNSEDNQKVEAAATTGQEAERSPVEEATETEERDTVEQPTETTQEEVATIETAPTAETELLAGTDVSNHIVPLEDILFDTFNGSYAPLSEASESLILQLRDAIPPIEEPVYESVEAADAWLDSADIVLGYVDGGVALAYPVRILNYHEIVNEEVNGIPVLISYCPLCNSGIVYDRRLDGEVLKFGNTSALYQSDMVMYDKQTFSYWFQVGGEAVVGDLSGKRLELLPTRFMRWAEWKEAYPDSQVLSRDTGFNRPYDRDPFTSLPQYLNQGRFPFPVGQDARNPSLPAGERVIGLVIDNEARAYPQDKLAGSVVNDEVGATPVAVVVNEADTAKVLVRRVGDKTLTLEWDGEKLKDAETGSEWSLSGEAISGPLEGERLEELPTRFSFWFAFVAAFPDATAYQPG